MQGNLSQRSLGKRDPADTRRKQGYPSMHPLIRHTPPVALRYLWKLLRSQNNEYRALLGTYLLRTYFIPHQTMNQFIVLYFQ